MYAYLHLIRKKITKEKQLKRFPMTGYHENSNIFEMLMKKNIPSVEESKNNSLFCKHTLLKCKTNLLLHQQYIKYRFL